MMQLILLNNLWKVSRQFFSKSHLGQLNYLDSCQEKPETIIFLHGFTQNSNSFSTLPKEITSNYRCLIPDLPGHGKTYVLESPTGFNTPAQIALLEEWLCSLGQNKIHLFGYSMGGRLALQFALKNLAQVQSLILVSTTAGIQEKAINLKRIQADSQLAEKILTMDTVEFLTQWLSQPLFQGIAEQGADFITQEIAKRLPIQKSGLACSLKYFSTGVMPSVWDQLSDLKIPSLIIAGSRDLKYTKLAHQLITLMPKANLMILETGHTPMIESPLLFWQGVINFLQAR